MVPLATNGTIGKITNGTIGRTPNRALISICVMLLNQRLEVKHTVDPGFANSAFVVSGVLRV